MIAAISEQESRRDMGFAMDAMRLPLEAHGFEVVGEVSVLGLFDRGAVTRHMAIMEQVKQAGMHIAGQLEWRLGPFCSAGYFVVSIFSPCLFH